MDNKRDWHPAVIAVLTAILVTAYVISAAHQQWGDLSELLLGGTGLVPLAVGIGTVVLLAIGAVNARRALAHTQTTVDLTRRGQVTTNFQKAAEMLGSENVSAETAAVILMIRCVDEAPELGPAAFRTVRDFIPEVQVAGWRRLFELLRLGTDYDETWPTTRPSVTFALRHLPQLYRKLPTDDPALKRPIEVTRVVMVGALYTGAEFVDMEITGAIVSHVHFVGCTFRNCTLAGTLGEAVIFRECTLVDFRMRFMNADRSEPTNDLSRLLVDRSCVVQNVTVNGLAAA